MDFRKIRKEALKQGWVPEPISSGEMFYSPNGVDKVAWHNTPSDVRAVRNFLSELKKGGFIWPPPKKSRGGS
jgi:hypothetical protein